MSSALKGDLRSLASLKRALRKMPVTAAARIAARAAPRMTELAGSAYDSGQTAYGRARPRGVDGKQLSLERTGDTRRALAFVALGTTTRLVRLPRYTKYLIGKYDILPNGPLPQAWRDAITDVAARVLHADIFGSEK